MQVGHIPNTVIVLEREVCCLSPERICKICCLCALCVASDVEHTRDQAAAANPPYDSDMSTHVSRVRCALPTCRAYAPNQWGMLWEVGSAQRPRYSGRRRLRYKQGQLQRNCPGLQKCCAFFSVCCTCTTSLWQARCNDQLASLLLGLFLQMAWSISWQDCKSGSQLEQYSSCMHLLLLPQLNTQYEAFILLADAVPS